MDNPLLVDAERELELEAIDLGITRYREWKERGSMGGPELQLVGLGIKRVEQSIQSVKDKIVSGEIKAGTGYLNWAPILLYFPADMLAGAALMATIESLIRTRAEQPTRQAVVMNIGAAVETMLHLLKAKDMDKDLYNILRKTIKHWDGKRARRFYRKVSGKSRALTLEERGTIGGFLFAHVQTTGWFVVTKTQRDAWTVSMDAEVSGELAKRHEQLELMCPMLYPLVIPPADWDEQGKGGGYIYHRHDIFKPVNPGDRPPAFGNAPIVIRSMNHIQRTRWAINRKVFEVQMALWEQGGGIAGMVRQEPYDVEAMVPRKEGATDDDIKRSKEEREKLHRANAADVGVRLEHLWRIRAAKRMLAFPAFYHTWQMDWRGRIYPRACCLTPQGSDLDRGLLTFADAIPQTDDGRRWLCIQLANAWALDGVDKASYPARVDWVRRHEDRIRSVAADPLSDRWWVPVYEERDGERVQVGGAENPWMFLAACFEYVRDDGLTQLPIQVDGSCNGLQHFSALGRDAIGGAAVNLTPCAEDQPPRSIYEEGAAEMRRLLAEKTSFSITKRIKDAAGKMKSVRVEIARPWLPKITKKVVKRGFMTTPYGLTDIGMRDQFIDDGWVTDAPDPFVSATVLRDLLKEAIGNIVVKAVEYMNWLKACAKIANEQNLPLQWESPTGMVITQDYVIPEVETLRLPGLGQLKFQIISEVRRELNRLKQINGICPNFIHTFDAGHLIISVDAAADQNITSTWLCHDSFGAHGPRVSDFVRILIDQFVKIYEREDHVAKFRKRNEERLGVALPDPPTPGALDLNSIRKARYPFS